MDIYTYTHYVYIDIHTYVYIHIHIYIYIMCVYIYILHGWHYLTNATCLMRPRCFCFYGITCLIQLIRFATGFATFEESAC